VNRIPPLLLTLGLAVPAALAAGAGGPPQAERRPVNETLHGQKITDDYRWLEDGNDPAVTRWSEAQNRYARELLDRSPVRTPLRARVKDLVNAMSPSYFDLQRRGGLLFARKFQPPREQPLLVVLKSADDPASERVLLDPVKFDARAITTIDFYVPSRDGELLAVSLSERGTEDGTLHLFEVGTGRKLPDVIPRVHGGTALGSVAWAGDGRGLYYTRYPRPGERPREDMNFYQQVWYHKLGTRPEEDRYAVGKEFPRIAVIDLESSEDGRHVLATVGNGDGGDYALHLLMPGGKWQQVAAFADGVKHGAFGRDGNLYLLSRKGAPRGQVLRVPLSAPVLAKAQTFAPQGEGVVQAVVPTSGRVYVVELVGGTSRLRALDLRGGAAAEVPVLPVSSVGAVERLAGDEILYRNESFLEPGAWYRYSPAAGKPVKTALRETSPVDFSDVEAVRRQATSKDGTRVPLTILLRRGTRLDGKNPTLLTGYGGFGVSLTPGFGPGRKVWLEQGGVMAIANLRGGGEFGEEWHKAGNLTRKQNVFDDFIACAELLIAERYTSPAHLAIEGGSNGGLLMGAVTTQRPELFRVVVAHVGIYDMLRFALWPNGQFNATEYGDVKDPEHFKALYGYSPYHRVKDGTLYPAVLFMSGQSDPRVNPADSRKLAARLQAATRSGRPILLRTSGSGHGATNLSDRIEQIVDKYTFIFAQLGMSYRPVKPLTQVVR
jgi:prolyl oligopeptidase